MPRVRFGIGMNTNHALEEAGQQFSVTMSFFALPRFARPLHHLGVVPLPHQDCGRTDCGASRSLERAYAWQRALGG